MPHRTALVQQYCLKPILFKANRNEASKILSRVKSLATKC